MAVGFHRALSTLTSPKAVAPSSLLDCARPKKLSYARIHSISLPVPVHPLVAGLHDSAHALLAWADAPAQTGLSWVADGAERVGRVLTGLAGLLHHPQAQDTLHRSWTEQLLDDLLLLGDFHGCFRESLVVLKQLLAETSVVLRRSAREISRLASSARNLSHRACPDDESDGATLADAFGAATAAVAATAAAVFSDVSSTSAESAASSTLSPLWLVTDLLRRRGTVSFEDYYNEEEEERKAAMGKVHGLEECVVAAEGARYSEGESKREVSL